MQFPPLVQSQLRWSCTRKDISLKRNAKAFLSSGEAMKQLSNGQNGWAAGRLCLANGWRRGPFGYAVITDIRSSPCLSKNRRCRLTMHAEFRESASHMLRATAEDA